MHTEITLILLRLTTEPDSQTGEPPLSRKQIAGWIGKSESYVDQRFQGIKDFKGSDIDTIMQKAFDLEIKPLIDRYIPKGFRLVDEEIGKYVIDGSLDDNISAIMSHLATVKDIGKDCSDTDQQIDRAHEQLETIRKELQAKS